MLGSTDLYVLAGVLAQDSEHPTLREIAAALHIDHTVVHRSLRRATEAGLYAADSKAVNRANFEELATHAARFIAPARLDGLTRGVPAAWAAAPIASLITQPSREPPPVWPDADGKVRGQALQPLHQAAVQASHGSPALSNLLAILDSLRAGDVRVRKVAAECLQKILRGNATPTLAP